MEVPTTFERWEDWGAEPADKPYIMHHKDGILFLIVSLAREVGLHSVLPIAYYCIVAREGYYYMPRVCLTLPTFQDLIKVSAIIG